MMQLPDLTGTNAVREVLRQFHRGDGRLLPGAQVGATGDVLHE